MDSTDWEYEARYEDWMPGLAMMRDALLEPLTDGDLSWSVGGSSLTWGQLLGDCVAMQRSYLDAFSTLSQHWESPSAPGERPTLVADLRVDFERLDSELAATLGIFSPSDWEEVIERPDGTKRTRRGQLEIYAQFMLIFLAKASVYTRAQGRDLPPSVHTFVG